MERVLNLVYWLQGRLWLIPAFMSLSAPALAYVLLGPGIDLFERFTDRWWLYSGDAGTARDLLSTLLAGMITMTSLVVSITVVVLSLAANQLGPRLIYNFIEDRRIQAVIGLFVATILYTLLALRTIGGELGGEAAVPHVVVTVASVLTVSCIFALLFHVNLIAHSIVSDTIVREVADALDNAARRLPRDPTAAAVETMDVWSHTVPRRPGRAAMCKSSTTGPCSAWPAAMICRLSCTFVPAISCCATPSTSKFARTHRFRTRCWPPSPKR